MRRPIKGLIVCFSLLISCCIIFGGCIKKRTVDTFNPYMTANIGTYDFTAATVVPATMDTQYHDTATALVITGNSSDPTALHDKIVLEITDYKGITGVFSIVEDHANATYIHSGIQSTALGGIVAITHITPTTIAGYFSFNTQDGLSVSNGAFTVGIP